MRATVHLLPIDAGPPLVNVITARPSGFLRITVMALLSEEREGFVAQPVVMGIFHIFRPNLVDEPDAPGIQLRLSLRSAPSCFVTLVERLLLV